MYLVIFGDRVRKIMNKTPDIAGLFDSIMIALTLMYQHNFFVPFYFLPWYLYQISAGWVAADILLPNGLLLFLLILARVVSCWTNWTIFLSALLSLSITNLPRVDWDISSVFTCLPAHKRFIRFIAGTYIFTYKSNHNYRCIRLSQQLHRTNQYLLQYVCPYSAIWSVKKA